MPEQLDLHLVLGRHVATLFARPFRAPKVFIPVHMFIWSVETVRIRKSM